MTLISFFLKKKNKDFKNKLLQRKYYFKKWRVILNILDFSKVI